MAIESPCLVDVADATDANVASLKPDSGATQPPNPLHTDNPAAPDPTAIAGDDDALALSEDDAESPPDVEFMSAGIRLIYLGAVLIPMAGAIAAAILIAPLGFNPLNLALLGGMYIVTGMGIGVGFHRLFTHRSYETGRFLTFIFGVAGSMAVEGPIMQWVAIHRRHHQYSDRPEDPHSPHQFGKSLWGMVRGLYHSHMGWMFKGQVTDFDRYVPDLAKDKLVRRIHNLFPLWVAIGLIVPAVLGGLITMSWEGVLLGFLWGGLLRVFLVHHITWSVNSVCHIWGSRPYKSQDQSTNNLLFGAITLGEGWHNNHHAFPTSARHGLRWWQLDVNYIVISALKMVGLVKNVKLPTRERMLAKLRKRPDA